VQPETKYAKKGDIHIAYQVVGEGPLDLVLCSLWFSHLEARWDIPAFAHYLRRLAAFTRLISFDKQGIGLSDPVPLDRMPPIEEWMDDVRVVMDEVGSERAVLMGANEGSLMAAVFAATYPERVEKLVLVNMTGCPTAGPDNEFGLPPEVIEPVATMIAQSWGTTEAMATLNPSVADDEVALAAWARFLRLCASPAVAAAVTRMIFQLDVREILPTIRVPTLVVNRMGNPLIPGEAGREAARRIPTATFVELPGDDYGVVVGDVDGLIDHVEEFVTGARSVHDTDRVLSTVLFADIVSSTERAVELGDAKWRELLEAFEHTGRQEVQRFGGVVADFAGDGLLASFDGPARAVRCAFKMREDLRAVGLPIRAGVHTGEVERRGERIAGVGVHTAARVLGQADPGEVLVSRTVKDLVAGSGLVFADRGTHQLKGVPDEWQLFAASG
jgi:class 3 adenylate cyclase